jgi:hypothetical protein
LRRLGSAFAVVSLLALGTAAPALAKSNSPCPTKWTLITPPGPPVESTDDSRYDDDFDRNGNNRICVKNIKGKGGGNTGNNYNLKDDKIR